MNIEAIDFLNQLNEYQKIDYSDYSHLHDLLTAESEPSDLLSRCQECGAFGTVPVHLSGCPRSENPLTPTARITPRKGGKSQALIKSILTQTNEHGIRVEVVYPQGEPSGASTCAHCGGESWHHTVECFTGTDHGVREAVTRLEQCLVNREAGVGAWSMVRPEDVRAVLTALRAASAVTERGD